VSEEKKQEQKQSGALAQAFKEIADPFIGLANSPRSLWGLYIAYLLEGLVYFGVLTVLGKYLSENVGLSDLHAGWVYSLFTGGITLSMLFMGGLSDKLGIRKALLFSLGIMIFGRALLGISGTFFPQQLGASSMMFMTVALGLLIVVFGYGTYSPAAYSAVKQFTNKKTASISYAMIYGLMNLGAFFSGIISPVIREGGGIASVFWVYTLLTILGFLTVAFVMTKKAVKNDTIAPESDESKDDDKTEKAAAVTAAPQAKLMTPQFLLFVSASALSVIAVIFMAISAPVQPGVQVMRDAKVVARDADLTGDNPTLIISETAEMIRNQAGLMVAPKPSHPDAVVDSEVYELVRYQMNQDAQVLDKAAAIAEVKIEAGTPAAVDAFHELQVLGLYYMAVAYAQVSPVDDAVIENLRSRLKEADADPVPLSDNQMTMLKKLVGEKDFGRICTALSEVTLAGADHVASLSPEAGSLVKPVLESNAELFNKVGGSAGSDSAKDFFQQVLLSQSIYLVKDLAPSFKVEKLKEGFFKKIIRSISGKEATVQETVYFSGVDLAASYLDQVSFNYDKDHIEGMIGSAEVLPPMASFLRWAKRYGLLVLGAVVCLIIMGAILLNKRPDHPFNDKRFVFFIFILIPVQTLFAHNWLTLPYYIDRAFGGTSVGDNFEFFSNLNPIMIFFMAPMVAALTTKAKIYPMMIWGTLVMAVPTFLLVLPPTPVFLLSYIFLMSIGEAMWQPRFLQWVAEIAPEGQTGTYMGIGQFPWFLTKVLTGLYSGYFLSQYCPAVGPQNTQFMWFVYSLVALITPAGLLLARKWMLSANSDKSLS